MAVMEAVLPSREQLSSPQQAPYCFGDFRLCLATRTLWRGDAPVPLTSRAMDLLAAFLRTPGTVISRDELMRRVWGSVSVLDSNLTVHLCLLRRALGPARELIAPVPGRGYQFIGEVWRRPGTPAAASPRAGLAVLPFQPLGDCVRYAALREALPKAVKVALARDQRIQLMADEGADWRLEGCYQETGERVRVTVELVRTRDGAIPWADRRDFAAADRFVLHDEISAWLSEAVSREMAAVRT